jgi:hypothetical protein
MDFSNDDLLFPSAAQISLQELAVDVFLRDYAGIEQGKSYRHN